jgi:hypothetical protein
MDPRADTPATQDPPAISELTLLIAERANRLALKRCIEPGGELALWFEAEAQVKRELSAAGETP